MCKAEKNRRELLPILSGQYLTNTWHSDIKKLVIEISEFGVKDRGGDGADTKCLMFQKEKRGIENNLTRNRYKM